MNGYREMDSFQGRAAAFLDQPCWNLMRDFVGSKRRTPNVKHPTLNFSEFDVEGWALYVGL